MWEFEIKLKKKKKRKQSLLNPWLDCSDLGLCPHNQINWVPLSINVLLAVNLAGLPFTVLIGYLIGNYMVLFCFYTGYLQGTFFWKQA